MSDNSIAVLVLCVLVMLLGVFIYKLYMLNKTSTKQLLKTSDFNRLLENIDYMDGFNYFLNEKPVNYEDFEKEKLFLLQCLEKSSESLKELADVYEQVEIYIDYKLANTPDPQQTVLVSFYTAHYQITKELVTKKFEEKLNNLLGNKISYFLNKEKNPTRPKGINDRSLAIRLFKLKAK